MPWSNHEVIINQLLDWFSLRLISQVIWLSKSYSEKSNNCINLHSADFFCWPIKVNFFSEISYGFLSQCYNNLYSKYFLYFIYILHTTWAFSLIWPEWAGPKIGVIHYRNINVYFVFLLSERYVVQREYLCVMQHFEFWHKYNIKRVTFIFKSVVLAIRIYIQSGFIYLFTGWFSVIYLYLYSYL